VDPKLAWAVYNLTSAPVELNTADRNQLLRIPGIGPTNANRIISARRRHRLAEIGQLRSLGINSERAAPYILLNGKRPPLQYSLW
jgi:predicted DNA-binding helix-hairpin-helix protein